MFKTFGRLPHAKGMYFYVGHKRKGTHDGKNCKLSKGNFEPK